MNEFFVEELLLAVLVFLAIAAVRQRDLLASSAVLGAYSLVMAVLWCTMNALDVGFTEAAVGAGISTVLMLAALQRIGRFERGSGFGAMLRRALESNRDREARFTADGDRPAWGARFIAVGVCVAVACMLVYGAQDMPIVGDPDSPANINPDVAMRYITRSPDMPGGQLGEVGPANIVTSVLGDYRGYDTMGETVVIFTAALGVLLLLRQARPRRKRGGPDDR